jgi:class 3 adenylate cyclase
MDLGGWLRRLGLEQYEATFRKNEIDDTVLPSLTAEDLKDLGVGFVGHRRKLLDAIAALRAEASAPTPLSDTPLATGKASNETAERRQVTVMFSDLVGSTALSARMDPEDLREVISAYQRCVAETVRRFGGFVARYMGDGVLIDFGYRKLTRLLRRDLSVPADRHTLADTITIPVVDEIGLSMFEAETRHHSGAH